MDNHANDPRGPGDLEIQARINEAVNSANQPLQEAMAMLIGELRTLREETATTQTPQSSAAEPTPAPAAPPAAPRTRMLPNPPAFNGNSGEYSAWSQQMRDKINLDYHLLGSDHAAFYLIYSCLGPQPQQTVSIYYEAGGQGGLRNPYDFMSHLDRTYLDPNLQARALSALTSLRQPENQPFTTHLPRFERLLTKAGRGTWSDDVKIIFLKGTLNSLLSAALVPQTSLPTDYHEWVRAFSTVAFNAETHDRAQKARGKKGTPHRDFIGKYGGAPSKDHEGDTRMAGVNQVRRDGKPGRDRREKPQRGRSEGKRTCWTCDSPDHLRRDCPREQSARAKVAATSLRKDDEGWVTPDEHLGDDAEESGNEQL